MRYDFDVALIRVRHKPVAKPEPKKRAVSPLLRTLVLAYQISDYIRMHKISSQKAFCRHAHISTGRITQIMRMLQLSPRIQERILVERDSRMDKLSEPAIRHITMQIVWDSQEETWKFL